MHFVVLPLSYLFFIAVDRPRPRSPLARARARMCISFLPYLFGSLVEVVIILLLLRFFARQLLQPFAISRASFSIGCMQNPKFNYACSMIRSKQASLMRV